MKIRKKCWPGLFEKMMQGKKNADVRLADFAAKEGDVIVLEEFDPATKKYTGRKLEKKIKNISKVQLLDFNDFERVKKYGHYVMEFE